MNISNKVFAIAMVVMMAAGASPVANAQSAADLQAQIAALLAQISQLQSQLGSGSGSGSAPSYNFTRNLTVGSRGDDVKALQQWLNANGYAVAASGVGSAGNETTYFGPATRAALAKFQAANGVSPAAGYFGPLTRNKLASLGGGVVVVPGGPTGSAVVIHPSSPAAQTMVTNQSNAELARFKFNGNYTVTGITLQRTGLSSDNSLSSVFLFEGDTRLTDSASVTAGSMLNFSNPSGLFTVNGSKDISVKANLAGLAGETLGVRLVSYTISGGQPVTVNLSGATHSLATASLATVSLGSGTASGNTDPGNDVLVWQSTASVGVRDVVLNRVALRQIGSISSNDIRNFRLYVDGVLVSTVAGLDSNGYVTFAGLSKAMQSGSRTLKVLADVVAGSGRTVQMSLRGAYDITVTDTQYNVSPAVTGSFPVGAAAFTVNNGTISVVRASDSPSGNVTLNGNDQLLGKWTVTAYGEAVKLETLGFAVGSYTDAAGSDNASVRLRNARVLINGAQYGSTASLTTAASGTVSYTTNYMVQPGTATTIELRADIFDNDGVGDGLESGDSLRVDFKQGSANGVPQVSLGSINVPSADQQGNSVTVTSGSLSLAKQANYGNQTVVVPQTGFKLGSYNLSAGSAEDITVTGFVLAIANQSGTTFTAADMTDVYIKYGSSQTPIKPTVSASNSYSTNFTVAKNTSMVVEVWGNVGSSITNGDTASTSLAVTANSASGVNSDVAAVGGQVLQAGAGSVNITTNDMPESAIVAQNTTQVTNKIRFSAQNDTYTITEMNVDVSDVTAVTEVQLWVAGAQVATRPAVADNTFSGLNIQVPINSYKDIEIRLALGTVGAGAGTSGAALTTTIDSMKYQSSNGTVTTDATDRAGNGIYVYRAIPTISKGNISSVLAAGEVDIAKFTVTGDITWKEVTFEITTTSVALSNFVLYKGTSIVTGTTTLSGTDTIFEALNEQGVGEYTLKAISDANAAGDSVVTRLDSDTTFVASNNYATVTGTTANFVWSDQSALSHSLTTTDWANDYKVPGLPMTWSTSK